MIFNDLSAKDGRIKPAHMWVCFSGTNCYKVKWSCWLCLCIVQPSISHHIHTLSHWTRTFQDGFDKHIYPGFLTYVQHNITLHVTHTHKVVSPSFAELNIIHVSDLPGRNLKIEKWKLAWMKTWRFLSGAPLLQPHHFATGCNTFFPPC